MWTEPLEGDSGVRDARRDLSRLNGLPCPHRSYRVFFLLSCFVCTLCLDTHSENGAHSLFYDLLSGYGTLPRHSKLTQSFTPACMHAILPRVLPSTTVALEVPANGNRVSNHLSKVTLARKAPEGFNEVLIRCAVACEDRSQQWDHRERALVIYPALQSVRNRSRGRLEGRTYCASTGCVTLINGAGKRAPGLSTRCASRRISGIEVTCRY